MPAAADRRVVTCASYGVQMIGSLLFILAAGVIESDAASGVLKAF